MSESSNGYKSSVLTCNIGDCECKVCSFLMGNQSTENLLEVIRVLDDALSNSEEAERQLLRTIVRINSRNQS